MNVYPVSYKHLCQAFFHLKLTTEKHHIVKKERDRSKNSPEICLDSATETKF